MRSLLKSDFGRLFKSVLFYILLVITFFSSMYMQYADWSDPDCTSAEFAMGDFWIFGLIFVSIIVPMFVCTDFSCGMIRNKITVGHSRFKVYCSSLITSVTASLLMAVVWLLGFYPLGIIHFGFNAEGIKVSSIFLSILGYMVMISAFTTIIHFICTLVTKKSIVIILSILFVLIYTTFFQPMVIIYAYSTGTIMEATEEEETEDGLVVTYSEVDNPFYFEDGSPEKRTARAVDTVVVPGQIVALAMIRDDMPQIFIAYDLCVIIVVTALGNVIFARKNLR